MEFGRLGIRINPDKHQIIEIADFDDLQKNPKGEVLQQ